MPGSWIRRSEQSRRDNAGGRVVGVDDHEAVAMAHGGEQPEQLER